MRWDGAWLRQVPMGSGGTRILSRSPQAVASWVQRTDFGKLRPNDPVTGEKMASRPHCVQLWEEMGPLRTTFRHSCRVGLLTWAGLGWSHNTTCLLDSFSAHRWPLFQHHFMSNFCNKVAKKTTFVSVSNNVQTQREINKYPEGIGALHLVPCRCNFLERIRERGRKSANDT